MKTKALVVTLLILLAYTVSAQAITDSERQKVREALAIDYSMPDYSVKKIDEKVMGKRLANILKSINANYK